MIDTDKYEGHTPGPWEWFLERIIQADDAVGNEGWVPIAIMDSTEEDYKKEDARLIADAPLLLAEVERLRDHIRRMRHWAEPKMHEVHHDAWRKLHEEIYEGDEDE